MRFAIKTVEVQSSHSIRSAPWKKQILKKDFEYGCPSCQKVLSYYTHTKRSWSSECMLSSMKKKALWHAYGYTSRWHSFTWHFPSVRCITEIKEKFYCYGFNFMGCDVFYYVCSHSSQGKSYSKQPEFPQKVKKYNDAK